MGELGYQEGRDYGVAPVCPKAPQMLRTINSTNPTPTNNTASATESCSSQCRQSQSIWVTPTLNVFGNRLVDQHLPHPCFKRISPQRFLVSRFVAKTWPAFRTLWQESGSAELSNSTNVCQFGIDGASL